MPSRPAELAAAALLSLTAVRAAGAQTLGVDGDRFTVDGQRRFLVFVSYFDGIRRIPDDLASTAILDSDLDYFAAKGVAGLRVFPNWQFRSETLMDCNGTLRPLQVAKLKTLVDRAAAKHLVVDLSFTIDVVKNARGTQCLSAAGYKQALEATTVALLGRTNVFFDLQNEHDKNRPPADKAHGSGWTPRQWTEYLGSVIRPAVKGRDGTRIVTVSWTSDLAPEQVYSNVETYGYDVLAYHHRGAGWETKTAVYVEALKQLFDRRGPARPVYIQEPNRFPFDTTVEHYETAITNAKRSGAAAWTFHNSVVETSKPLKGALPFEQLLEPGERVFLDRLASTGAASSDQTRQFDFAEMSLRSSRVMLRGGEPRDEDQPARFSLHRRRRFECGIVRPSWLALAAGGRRSSRSGAAAAIAFGHRARRRGDDGKPQLRSSARMVTDGRRSAGGPFLHGQQSGLARHLPART